MSTLSESDVEWIAERSALLSQDGNMSETSADICAKVMPIAYKAPAIQARWKWTRLNAGKNQLNTACAAPDTIRNMNCN